MIVKVWIRLHPWLPGYSPLTKRQDGQSRTVSLNAKKTGVVIHPEEPGLRGRNLGFNAVRTQDCHKLAGIVTQHGHHGVVGAHSLPHIHAEAV